jgi:Polyketide cyclase / dehydrase and lipid transport
MSRDEAKQRDLLPEEKAAGSDDPGAETTAILAESETRAEERLSSGGRVEHRTSDAATESGLTFSDSVFVARPPAELYDLVSDVTRMGEWSPICTGCRWRDDDRGAGAWFTGHNETSERTWETESLVVAADPGREFTFVVGGDRARWSYTFLPIEGGTELTESWDFLPAGLAVFEERYGPDAPAEMQNRIQAARTGIPVTLAAIKKVAES